MRQRDFAACSLASAVCLCLTVLLWVRSYRTCDLWSVGNPGGHHFAWDFDDRAHPLPSYPPPIPVGASGWMLSGFGVLAVREDRLVPGPRSHAPRGFSWSTQDKMFPSFGLDYVEPADMLDRGWWVHWQLSLCYWFIAVCFSVAPLLFLVRAWWNFAARNRTPRRTATDGRAFSEAHA